MFFLCWWAWFNKKKVPQAFWSWWVFWATHYPSIRINAWHSWWVEEVLRRFLEVRFVTTTVMVKHSNYTYGNNIAIENSTFLSCYFTTKLSGFSGATCFFKLQRVLCWAPSFKSSPNFTANPVMVQETSSWEIFFQAGDMHLGSSEKKERNWGDPTLPTNFLGAF